MSEIKVNKISPRSGTDVTLGDSGDTFTIPSGATFTNSGTATGFAAIAWQSITTAATLTAVAGRGYPINTTSNACTVTLPASASVGDQIIFTDYLRTWGTNAVTINPNSLKFQGYTTPQPVYDTNGESVHIVYMDVTQGWVPINDGAVAFETDQSYSVEYLVVAGGGGGGGDANTVGGAGAGAGGLRTSYGSTSGGGASAETALTLAGSTVYTITVGAGGTGRTGQTDNGSNGGTSSISGSDITDVTTVGGGRGAYTQGYIGTVGGSGGGSAYEMSTAAAAGTANQGFAGGQGVTGLGGQISGGGGGGAVSAGATGTTNVAPDGGAGLNVSITGASVGYAGGGGTGTSWGSGGTTSTATHGGGAGGTAYGNNNGFAGTVNTGGGGGGGSTLSGGASNGGDGGTGVVILRMADAKYTGTTTGSPTVATDVGGLGETVLTFTVSGSYTA